MQKVAYIGLILGVLAWLLFLGGALTFRTEILGLSASLNLVKCAAVFGLIGLVMSLVATLRFIRISDHRGLRYAGAGLLLGLAIGLPMLQLRSTAARVPRIHDITTDIENPPAFEAVLPLRDATANPATYAGAEIGEKQKAAYPEIEPKLLTRPPRETFDLALGIARMLKWDIVSAEPSALRIEATQTSFLFGFKDDIVVRVTPEGTGSRLDIRSASRVGVSDLGKNAERIKKFFIYLK